MRQGEQTTGKTLSKLLLPKVRVKPVDCKTERYQVGNKVKAERLNITITKTRIIEYLNDAVNTNVIKQDAEVKTEHCYKSRLMLTQDFNSHHCR